ncbi:site-specific integrase [Thalassoroseus pseudoceratinae]|uniref:site-specific integrase n=1 Tax=Thalassoroseus pseudoceratinae TaxID=2713176 RepID=UPI00141EB75B|nr:site-specific integrase [Thalassoroseus pseudoceratinae]
MKLLERYRAACEVRRLAKRTIQTDCRWVEEYLRFHHDRTGHWIHPQEMEEKEVEAFLTHLAVNRRLAESTQNQALGAILFMYRNVLKQPLGPLDAVRANRLRVFPKTVFDTCNFLRWYPARVARDDQREGRGLRDRRAHGFALGRTTENVLKILYKIMLILFRAVDEMSDAVSMGITNSIARIATTATDCQFG